MSTNSHAKAADYVLATPRQIEKFLLDCVNLPNPIDYPDDEAFGRWLSRWQRSFTYFVEVKPSRRRSRKKEPLPFENVEVPQEELRVLAPVVRTTLRRVWEENDPRQRDWYFYRLRDAHRQMVRHLEGASEDPKWDGPNTIQRLVDYAVQEVPRLCPFEVAMLWAQSNQKLMVYCRGENCAAPYFFRKEKGQKFCSPECADFARREAKRKWWHQSRNSPKNRRTEAE